jgi:hypothetical protein
MKIIVSSAIQEIAILFLKPEISLVSLQEPITDLYPEQFRI